MDPLSVTASIVGLLGATANVIALAKAVKSAPSLMRNVQSEVSDIQMSLYQLQTLLGPKTKFRSQASLLMVKHIVVVFSNAVIVVSKLEKIMEQFKKEESLRVVSRVKLALKEETISKLLQRLQSSRLSLSLMLTTLTCSSVQAAQDSQRQLNTLVQRVLESNQEISSRLASMGFGTAPNSVTSTSQDTKATNGSSSTSRSRYRVSRSSLVETMDNAQDLIKKSGLTFDVQILSRNSNMSYTSSVVPSMGWSYPSGLSLANVSNISVFLLPISPNELWNADHYIFNTTLLLPSPSIGSSHARGHILDKSMSPSIQSGSPLKRIMPTLGHIEDEDSKGGNPRSKAAPIGISRLCGFIFLGVVLMLAMIKAMVYVSHEEVEIDYMYPLSEPYDLTSSSLFPDRFVNQHSPSNRTWLFIPFCYVLIFVLLDLYYRCRRWWGSRG